jgi:hypothetical protein
LHSSGTVDEETQSGVLAIAEKNFGEGVIEVGAFDGNDFAKRHFRQTSSVEYTVSIEHSTHLERSMTTKKIGLAGKSGSGKDVVADFICVQFGYSKIAVADAIREEVQEFLKESLSANLLPGSFSLVVDAFVRAVWDKPTAPEIRVLLQWWGTEYRRSEDSNYWIKRLTQRLEQYDKLVISDVRVPDEMDAIRNAGGEIWLVERPGIGSVGIKNHFTETALADSKFDRIIYNDRTLDDLYVKITSLF